MHTEGSVEVDRPIDEVFRLTTEHVAEWSLVVKEERMQHRTENGVGTTFLSITEDHGRTLEFQGVVTAHEPPYRSAVQLIGDMFDIEAEYLFEDLGGRTRVTQKSDVHPKGVVRIFFKLFGWLMGRSSRNALQKELRSLKEFCERNRSH